MDNVISIPITYSTRKKNEMGKGYVPCEISSRYLKIKGISEVKNDKLVILDVMTENDKGKGKKICEMVISLEDFSQAVNEMMEDKD